MGLHFVCEVCSGGFCLCFKCFRSKNVIHNHELRRTGMESDGSDPASEYTSDDSIDDEVEILDNRYEASDDVIDGDDNSEE